MEKNPHRENRSELHRESGNIHSLALSRSPSGGSSALDGLTAALVGKRCRLQSGMQGSVFSTATSPFLQLGGVTTR